jgi:hypothetical protein
MEWILVLSLALLLLPGLALKRRERSREAQAGGLPAIRPELEALWEWQHQNIPLKYFGGGAQHPFDYYFTRESRVEVSTIDEIVAWLLECHYVSDREQFNERDHWQHPVDFEVTRKGDCEDFALWAWRKLVELGHDAEFMVGKWVRGERAGSHAWVLLRHAGETWVFESTGRSPMRVMRRHAEAAAHYVPFASVDKALKKKVYQGIAWWALHEKGVQDGGPEASEWNR